MADLQNILGTMLATGMGGRSGMGMESMGSIINNSGGLGAGPMEASSTGRSGMGVGSVAGLGALAYIAYRAFQERQQNMRPDTGASPTDAPASGTASGGGLWGGSSGGGILGSIFGGAAGGAGGSLADRLSQMLQPRAPQPETQPETQPDAAQPAPTTAPADEGAYPALAMEDQQALLLIRAMIAAANADGEITAQERGRILSALDEAGAGPEERQIVEQELDRPQSLDNLVQAVHDPQTAEQVYMASMMAVDRNSETERSYLQYLATRLRIDPQRLQQMNQAA